ncbi:hypothetical protein DAPPUDRAFT_233686 [Daphnia pulex]|uniref:Uncharacterized protein n=1 Tax=Daphnia pulex TaxID=6669 RepID=E9FVG2_DAPPU|nr:hypothetical protein DAPPUDRAFT_233686 [Daphnia pulex]|eukprot:EFX88550.1 hypothetical protein DAPPUDRAFT_233686 [Daphnia pulex]
MVVKNKNEPDPVIITTISTSLFACAGVALSSATISSSSLGVAQQHHGCNTGFDTAGLLTFRQFALASVAQHRAAYRHQAPLMVSTLTYKTGGSRQALIGPTKSPNVSTPNSSRRAPFDRPQRFVSIVTRSALRLLEIIKGTPKGLRRHSSTGVWGLYASRRLWEEDEEIIANRADSASSAAPAAWEGGERFTQATTMKRSHTIVCYTIAYYYYCYTTPGGGGGGDFTRGLYPNAISNSFGYRFVYSHNKNPVTSRRGCCSIPI